MNSPFFCLHKLVLIFYSLTDIDDLKYLNKINSGLRLPLAAPQADYIMFWQTYFLHKWKKLKTTKNPKNLWNFERC